LQRELEAHAASIEYLRNAGDESGDNKTLKFRNTLKNVLEKLAEDYK